MKVKQLILFTIILSINIILAEQISFFARQDSNNVYLGDATHIQLTLDTSNINLNTPAPPLQLGETDSDNFTVVISKTPSVSKITSQGFFNGARKNNSKTTYVWNALITPISTNAIPSIKFEINVNGKNYVAKTDPIEIIAPQPSLYAEIELSTDNVKVICGDTFKVNSTLKLAAVLEDNKLYQPFHPNAYASLLLPHLDKQFEEIELIGNGINELLEYSNPNARITINNYAQSSMWNGREPFLFELPNDVIIENGTNYFIYSWSTIYKAKKTATIEFSPISFRGTILINTPLKSIEPQIAFVASNPLTITISEPPMEGRPYSFTGAISENLKIDTTLDSQICKEGDPITLTLEINNVKNPHTVTPPDLKTIPNFTKYFRSFGETKADIDEKNNKLKFEYKLRPLIEGTIELPPIELSYYNTSSNIYSTCSTAPIPLRVDPAPQVAAFDDTQIVNLPEKNSRYYPTAISFDTNVASCNVSFFVKQLAILAPFIWIAALLLRKLHSKREHFIGYFKNMSATDAAIKRLSKAESPAEIMTAVSTFIGKKFKIKTTGSTPDDIVKALHEQNTSSEVITELSKPLKRIFNLSFAPNADIPTEVADAKEKLLPVLQKLKGKSSTLPQICISIGAILACIAIVGAPIIAAILLSISTFQIEKHGTPDKYELRQANLLVNTAISKEDFTAIATNYYTRFNYNFNSDKPIPTLLHNYATALTLAGHPQKAINVIEHIEAITGATKELDNSRLFAMQTLQEQDSLQAEEDGTATILESPTLPWYRFPLFWHYKYSISERGNALCIIWTMLWMLLIIRLFPTNKKPLNIATALLLIVFIFVSSSYLASRELLNNPIPKITAEELLLEQEQTIKEGLPNE